jgi:hypothetical protein
MLTPVISFDELRTVLPGERARIYWNVDQAGNADGSAPDTSTPAAEVDLWPGIAAAHKHGVTAWGGGAWGGEIRACGQVIEMPRVHFGLMKIGAKSADSIGNEQSGSMIVATQTINSTPTPVARFERSGYAAGQQSFTYMESEQLRQ